MANGLEDLRRALEREGSLVERGRVAAELIRSARGYRWVGVYRVEPPRIVALAWTGGVAPSHTSFPITKGLCGAAVSARTTQVAGDVARDPHGLETFASTRSEIVVPVRCGDAVVGLLDVESDRANAFADGDRTFLEGAAGVLAERWGDG